MTEAERIYAEYRDAWPGDLDTALKLMAMEVAYLGRRTSPGYVRAKREDEPRPGKAKPPAVVITGEPDA